MATAKKTTRRRSTSARKTISNSATYFEKALAYLIVALCVYGCFIYDPSADPLHGLSYNDRLRAERHAYTNGNDIYDYRNKSNVQAYNRKRHKSEPSYYDWRTGKITSAQDYNRRNGG